MKKDENIDNNSEKKIKIPSIILILIFLFLVSIFIVMAVYIVDIVKDNIYLEQIKVIAKLPDNVMNIARVVETDKDFINCYKIKEKDKEIVIEFYGYCKHLENNFNMIEITTFYINDDGTIKSLDMETTYPSCDTAKNMIYMAKVYNPEKITRIKNVVKFKNGKFPEEYVASEFLQMLKSYYKREEWIELED